MENKIDLEKEISLLKLIVINLWKSRQYNKEYISYLLGNTEIGEFKRIAESRIKSFDEINVELLSFSSQYVSNLLNSDINSVDLSTLLNVDPTLVNEILKSLKEKK